ncbi:MAG: hypothetical protein ABGX27_03300 [Desulfurobacteriaceae bacterium]
MKKLLAVLIALFSLATANAGINTLYSWKEGYEHGRKVNVMFEYSFSNNGIFDNVKRVEIAFLKYKNYLRHGGSFAFGWKKFESKGIRHVEGMYNFLLQIPYFGADRKILVVADMFSVIPFGGMALGLGLHSDDFPSAYKFSDSQDWLKDFVQNYVIARLKIGADIVIADGLAVQFLFTKDLTMEKAYSFGVGINVDF